MKRALSEQLILIVNVAAIAALLGVAGCAAGNDPGGSGGMGQGGDGNGGTPKPKVCERGCPSGYSCNEGVCEGGDETMLSLPIEMFTVSGTITVNGQAPVSTEGCSDNQVRITFSDGPLRTHWFDPVLGSAIEGYVACAATDGSFSVQLPKGTYRALVSQYSTATSFPDATFVAAKSFDVKGAISGVKFDLGTVAIGGRLTVDGQAPTATEECQDNQVRITLVDDDGANFTGYVPCSANGGGFSAVVAPGKYRVMASQYSTATTFPDATFLVEKSFTVSSSPGSIAWNLPTVTIRGRLTVDGQPPSATEECQDNQVRIELVDDAGASFEGYVPCTATNGAFSIRVAPGKYKVLASQYSTATTFPDATFAIDPSFDVTTSSSVTWALKTVAIGGRLTVNGQTPIAVEECQDNQVRISLVDDAGAHFEGYVPCTATDGAFSVRAAPGKYRVLASQYTTATSFPDATFLVEPSFDAATAGNNVSWALKTSNVAGHLTVDGQAPMAVSGCSDNQVRLTFINSLGAHFEGFIACATTDGSFDASVAPGTYAIIASQYTTSTSFPDATFALVDQLEVK